MCCGNSILFPVKGMYVQFSHTGEGLLLASGSFSVRGFLGRSGVVQMGGNCDNNSTGGGDSGQVDGKGMVAAWSGVFIHNHWWFIVLHR